jgi:hypothetical protein
VLSQLAQTSDVIYFNVGLHYERDENASYRKSVSTALEALVIQQKLDTTRLKLVVAVECSPTHFASRDGSGLFRTKPGLPALAAKCLYKDNVQHEMAQKRPVAFPPGYHSFLCAPITDFSTAAWRNDIMNAEAQRIGVPVIARFELLKHRCDLLIGIHMDCLHYDWQRARWGGLPAQRHLAGLPRRYHHRDRTHERGGAAEHGEKRNQCWPGRTAIISLSCAG